ncbi:MAG TPA: NfeD family protein [Mycobacteriales bacterium]|nr:NfeD family protein [Mycobacteriales bacterium]
MADWVFWVVLAGGLMVAELFTLTFVLGLFSVAALAAGVAALVGLPLVADLTVFAGASGVLWWLVKPLERSHRRQPALATGTAALTGQKGLVTEEVTTHAGRVTLGGESWAARSLSPGLVLLPGSHVAVAEVDGATLVVFPEEI